MRTGLHIPIACVLVSALTAALVAGSAGLAARDDSGERASKPLGSGAPSHPRPATVTPGLGNLILAAPDVYSGAEPQGDEGFDALLRLGVRTVVSVDGAAPDADRARSRGLRTVHLPIGYDGIRGARAGSIAAALRQLPRPIYVHCYHGTHRGPAATAAALIATGELTPDRGIELLELAGTSERYTGLFECVRTASVLPESVLMAEHPWPEVAPVPALAESMAAIGRSWDELRLVRTHAWRVPGTHPDLAPAQSAAHIADLLRALREDPRVVEAGVEFAFLLADNEHAARRLEDATAADADPEMLDRLFREVAASCVACHAEHRD